VFDRVKFREFIKKAWQEVRRAIKDADVILEVLDARDPPAFRNLDIEKKIIGSGKKLILVINKVDLVPREVAEKWKREFEKEFPTVCISARYRLGTLKLRKLIYKLAPKDTDVIRVAIIGYPNVGKSSIINILKGKHGAPTSSIPGFTRHAQIFKRGRLIILDTPGVYPVEDPFELVYKGAVRVEQLEIPEKYAIKLIEYLKSLDPYVVKKHYGDDVDDEKPEKILEKLAIKMKKFMRGGIPDIRAAARKILYDWINGKIVVWRKPP